MQTSKRAPHRRVPKRTGPKPEPEQSHRIPTEEDIVTQVYNMHFQLTPVSDPVNNKKKAPKPRPILPSKPKSEPSKLIERPVKPKDKEKEKEKVKPKKAAKRKENTKSPATSANQTKNQASSLESHRVEPVQEVSEKRQKYLRSLEKHVLQRNLKKHPFPKEMSEDAVSKLLSLNLNFQNSKPDKKSREVREPEVIMTETEKCELPKKHASKPKQPTKQVQMNNNLVMLANIRTKEVVTRLDLLVEEPTDEAEYIEIRKDEDEEELGASEVEGPNIISVTSSPELLCKHIAKRKGTLPQCLMHEIMHEKMRFRRRNYPDHMRRVTDVLALDCEFMGGMRNENVLGRVSLVNMYGFPVYDFYVNPGTKIRDYRTRYSGISPAVLTKARKKNKLTTAPEAKAAVRTFASKSVIVGHAISNDFRVLGIRTDEVKSIDTQVLGRYAEEGLASRPSLSNVMKKYYRMTIQASKTGHSSVEDARSSMLIYRTFQKEFDSLKSVSGNLSAKR